MSLFLNKWSICTSNFMLNLFRTKLNSSKPFLPAYLALSSSSSLFLLCRLPEFRVYGSFRIFIRYVLDLGIRMHVMWDVCRTCMPKAYSVHTIFRTCTLLHTETRTQPPKYHTPIQCKFFFVSSRGKKKILQKTSKMQNHLIFTYFNPVSMAPHQPIACGNNFSSHTAAAAPPTHPSPPGPIPRTVCPRIVPASLRSSFGWASRSWKANLAWLYFLPQR